MGENLRYNLQHMGDNLFDKITSASERMKGSTRGISLTYKIGELKKEKEKLVNRIGKRVVGVRKAGKPDADFATDTRLNNLFKRHDDIQKVIDDCIAERKGRLYPR